MLYTLAGLFVLNFYMFANMMAAQADTPPAVADFIEEPFVGSHHELHIFGEAPFVLDFEADDLDAELERLRCKSEKIERHLESLGHPRIDVEISIGDEARVLRVQ